MNAPARSKQAVLFVLSMIPFVSVPWPSLAFASAGYEPVGIVVRIDGPGLLLTQPSSSAAGPSPRVKFEGIFYTAKELKVGMPVQNGNIVRTGPGTKAAIAFTNGDHFAVGPGTEYVIRWNPSARTPDKKKTEVDLRFGSIRGVVQPGGENQGLRLRSRAATMGVRGTEFYVEDSGTGPLQSKIAVLRGKVEVSARVPAAPGRKGSPMKEGKPQEVPAGAVANVTAPGVTEKPSGSVFAVMEPEESTIAVAPLNKKEVSEIRETTAVPPAAPAVSPAASSSGAPEQASAASPVPEATVPMPDLEKAMGEALLADIKVHEPELFQEIAKTGDPMGAVASIEKIQEVAFVKLEEKAPEAPPVEVEPAKPTLKDLEQRDDAVYEEYLPPSE